MQVSARCSLFLSVDLYREVNEPDLAVCLTTVEGDRSLARPLRASKPFFCPLTLVFRAELQTVDQGRVSSQILLVII